MVPGKLSMRWPNMGFSGQGDGGKTGTGWGRAGSVLMGRAAQRGEWSLDALIQSPVKWHLAQAAPIQAAVEAGFAPGILWMQI